MATERILRRLTLEDLRDLEELLVGGDDDRPTDLFLVRDEIELPSSLLLELAMTRAAQELTEES